MVTIEILHVDLSNKIAVIKAIREITGWSLQEAQTFVDGILDGSGSNVLTQVPSKNAQEIIQKLSEAGIEVKTTFSDSNMARAVVATPHESTDVSLCCPQCGAKFKEKVERCQVCGYVFSSPGAQSAESPEMNGKFIPSISLDKVSELSREKTMEVLEEAKKIAETCEYYELEIPRLQNAIVAGNNAADAMRKKISGRAKMMIFLAVVVSAILAGFIELITDSGFLAIIVIVAGYFIASSNIRSKDLKEHEAENNARADKHIADYVKPTESLLAETLRKKEEFFNSGRVEWGKGIVGDDLFYSGCIADLYNLVKSRRADDLKEALNKYDDQRHKQQMEEMQKAIQNAAEVSAKESAKQTAQLGKIEKNTHQSATASKISAAANLGTYFNTKKRK